MKNMFKVLLVLIMSCSVLAEQLPTAIQKAHEAYLRRDGVELITAVKLALEQADDQNAIKKNMLGLYTAAARNGLLKNVKLNWLLPKELTYAGFESTRRYRVENGKVVYYFALSVGVQSETELEQLQIIRYPDHVILDRAAQIGKWEITSDSKETHFYANSPQTSSPNEEGLYFFNIKVKDQPMVQAWFIFANKNSSATPIINNPKSAQTLSDGRPVFSWNSFLSPEYKQGEEIRIDVRVNRAGGDEPKVAQFRMIDSKATSYKFGDATAVKIINGPDQLTIGDYSISLTYREIEKFGGLQLKRTSSTKVPFTIKY